MLVTSCLKFMHLDNDQSINDLSSNLKLSKSTGIDSIPARILKLSPEIIWTWSFNLCIKRESILDYCNKAWVISIYKSENRNKRENYRLISILPIISKTFERSRSVFKQ